MLLLEPHRPVARTSQPLRRLLTVALACSVVLVSAIWSAADAHEGHDHGPAPAAAGVTPPSPRVVATSDAYQLVGIAEGEVLVVYLDRAADNAPVTTATIEVSLNGQAYKAEPQKNGTYEVTAPLLRKPGQFEVLITVVEGGGGDLLAGALTLPDPAATNAGAAQGGLIGWISRAFAGTSKAGPSASAAGVKGGGVNASQGWGVPLLLLAAGLLAGLLIGRRGRGLPVVMCALAPLLLSPQGHADSRHDHGPDLSASMGNAPSRRPDGAIFLPKPSQRLLEVRTKILTRQSATRTVRLSGRIVANPNFSGVVQGSIPGRYQAPATGVPALGSRVKAGEVLGRIAPSFASVDASDMAQTLGDLEQKIAIAQAKLARQEQLLRTNVVARAAVDETRLEVEGLVRRKSQLLEARVRPEDLRAPVDGVIAAVRVVSGQIVAQTDQIFHIIDPNRLLVEALVFDQIDPDTVSAATAALADGTSLNLRFLGRRWGRSPRSWARSCSSP